MPEQVVQLGVAGVCVLILGWVIKLMVDGKLSPPSTQKANDDRMADKDKRIEQLTDHVETLTAALAASNSQSAALISLWKALQSDEEGD